jgi:hypothetical protein
MALVGYLDFIGVWHFHLVIAIIYTAPYGTDSSGISEAARPPPPVSDFALGFMRSSPHRSSSLSSFLGDGDAFSSLFMSMNIS